MIVNIGAPRTTSAPLVIVNIGTPKDNIGARWQVDIGAGHVIWSPDSGHGRFLTASKPIKFPTKHTKTTSTVC